MALHDLDCLLDGNVAYLWRGVVTTDLVSLSVQESAQTLAVLDVDG